MWLLIWTYQIFQVFLLISSPCRVTWKRPIVHVKLSVRSSDLIPVSAILREIEKNECYWNICDLSKQRPAQSFKLFRFPSISLYVHIIIWYETTFLKTVRTSMPTIYIFFSLLCFDIRWKSNHIKKEYTSLII